MNLNLMKTKFLLKHLKKTLAFKLKLTTALFAGLCFFTGTVLAHATNAKLLKKNGVALSHDAQLAGLSISVGTLSPVFNSTRYAYTDTIGNAVTSVTITATKHQSGATLRINRSGAPSGSPSISLPMAIGNNSIMIVVTAEDGVTKQTYTIAVHRIDNRPLAGNIEIYDILDAGNKSIPAFSNDVTNYSYARGFYPEDDSVIVNISKQVGFGKADVKLDGSSTGVNFHTAFYVKLHEGTNNIDVKITAEDGIATNTFNFVLTRPYNNTDLARLENFNPDETRFYITPAFSKDTVIYRALLTAGADSFYLSPKVIDPYARIKINGVVAVTEQNTPYYNFVDDAPAATLVVTARDGVTTKTYKVYTDRQGFNNNLKSIDLSEGILSPAFSPTLSNYTVTVSSFAESINIVAKSVEPDAKFNMAGQNIYTTGSITISSVTLIQGDNIFSFDVTGSRSDVTRRYTITVHRQSSEASLSNLNISSGPLNPLFYRDTYNYRDTVTVPSITVTPTTENALAKVYVNGDTVANNTASPSIPLSIGNNTITTLVKAENADITKTYTTIITRIYADALLSNIVPNVGNLNPSFKSTRSTYNVTISDSLSITLKPVASDAYPGVTVKVNGVSVTPGTFSAPVPLSFGNNAIPVVVTSADLSKTFTYTVNVKRQSSNANIGTITLSAGTLSAPEILYPNILAYNAVVNNATDSITIAVTSESPRASIKTYYPGSDQSIHIGAKTIREPLKVGTTSTFNFDIRAEDNSKDIQYLIKITRQSNNSNLQNLSISSGPLSPAFAINTLNYTASVAYDSTSISVKPYAANPHAHITVNGTPVSSNIFSPRIPLALGPNTISVVVTAEDSSKVRTYKIVVKRQSNNANLAGITLSSGTLSPAFAAGILSYTSSVSNATSSITVKPVAVNGHASMKVNGVSIPFGGTSASLPLVVGDNTITIATTSEDFSRTRTTTIIVNRAPETFAFTPQSKTDISGRSDRPVIGETLPQPLIRQAVSPNGDGINDVLLIDGVESFADNTLKIMNRDGNLVFQKAKYDNISAGFDGHSGINGRQLPAGTYFYSLEYAAEDGKAKHKTGFFVLKY
jgi:gliding motility-associated-like protein